MKKEVEIIVEEFLNEKVFNSDLLNDDIKWDKDGRVGESNEEKIIKSIIEVLEERIKYY